MKITSSKRDDILKRKAEYDADVSERLTRLKDQKQQYYKAEHDITSVVEEDIKSRLTAYRALQFDVDVTRGRYDNHNSLRVRVQCNEDNKFDDDVALSWRYEVNLSKDGEVQKESSSWSGLKATTESQLESLRQTLEALKYLNSVDWAIVLNKDLPDPEEYITERDPRYDTDKPDFKQELFEADIEEAISTGNLVKGYGYKYFRGDAWYQIIGETPKQYKVVELSEYEMNKSDNLQEFVKTQQKFAYNVSKTKFYSEIVYNPVEFMEV